MDGEKNPSGVESNGPSAAAAWLGWFARLAASNGLLAALPSIDLLCLSSSLLMFCETLDSAPAGKR